MSSPSTLKPITLYDYPGNASPSRAWNPHIWKARFALSIKGVPYHTVWLEYPEVGIESKKIGIQPTGKRADGSDLYTLPAIFDPNTGIAIVDSEKIAEYLETQYPDASKPVLFPPGSRALQLGFRDAFLQRVRVNLQKVLLHPISQQLNQASQPHFITTREKLFGTKLSELAPLGSEKYAAFVKAAIDGLGVVGSWIDANGSQGPFIAGDQPCFADCDVAAVLIWTKIISGEGEGSAWSAVAQADGGRWRRYLEAFDKWSTMH